MAIINEKQIWLDENTHHMLKIEATERRTTMRALLRELLEKSRNERQNSN